MAGTKVDIQAVDAELNAICARMSEVTRLMGPQVWQGGSAGNFTVDLQGHNRSLHLMMTRVLRAVAALNDLPMVISPPAMPQVTPAVSNGIASVSPSGLQRLEAALRHAAEALPRHAKRIQGLLSEAGPHDVSTAQCKRTAAWCHDQARPIRMRIRYAYASDQAGFSVLSPNGRMVGIPDKFGPKDLETLGRLQAELYKRQLENPGQDSREVLADIGASLRENSKDAAYLKAFFGNVPPGSVGKLAHSLHKKHSDGKTVLDSADEKTLGDFGTALALLSRLERKQRKNLQGSEAQERPLTERALGAYGSDMPGQGLLVKFSEGQWDSHVLAQLGQAALRWRLQHPSYKLRWPDSGDSDSPHSDGGDNRTNGRYWFEDWGFTQKEDFGFWGNVRGAGFGVSERDKMLLLQMDPARNILEKINAQKDDAAARELASTPLPEALKKVDKKQQPPLGLSRMPGDTYASLLIAPDWVDHGAAAAGVIKLATQGVRHGPAGKQSAEIAHNLMAAVSWWQQTGRGQVSIFLRQDNAHATLNIGDGSGWPNIDLQASTKLALFRMTKAYIPSLAMDDRKREGDTELPLPDMATGQWNWPLDQGTTANILRYFASDESMRQELALAVELFGHQQITHALKHGTEQDLVTAAKQAGQLRGDLTRVLQGQLIAEGKERQEAKENTIALLEMSRDTVNEFADSIPGVDAASKVTGVQFAWDTGTDYLFKKVKPKDLVKAQERAKKLGLDDSNVVPLGIALAIYKADGKGVKTLKSSSGAVAIVRILDDQGRLRENVSVQERELVIRWALENKVVRVQEDVEIDGRREVIYRHLQGTKFIEEGESAYKSAIELDG